MSAGRMRRFLERQSWRLRCALFGNPMDLPDIHRERIRDIHAVFNENDDQAERVPHPLPKHPGAVILRHPEAMHHAMAREADFRGYARRSGQRIADASLVDDLSGSGGGNPQ